MKDFIRLTCYSVATYQTAFAFIMYGYGRDFIANAAAYMAAVLITIGLALDQKIRRRIFTMSLILFVVQSCIAIYGMLTTQEELLLCSVLAAFVMVIMAIAYRQK